MTELASSSTSIREPTKGGESQMQRRTAIIATLAILIAAGIAAGGYAWWTRTPRYALAQAYKAIENHDVTTFHKYVDVDTLCKRAIDDVVSEVTEGTDKQDSTGMAQVGTAFAEGLIQVFKPRLVDMAKSQIDKYVETGRTAPPSDNEGDKAPDVQLTSIRERLGVPADLAVTHLAITTNGATATASIPYHNAELGIDQTLKLLLRDVGDHWQVVQLANLGDLLREVDKVKQDRLDAANQKIVTAMDHSLQLDGVAKKNHSDQWGISKKVSVLGQFENTGKVAIKDFEGSLIVRDASGKKVRELGIKASMEIPAGEKKDLLWQFDINEFIDKDEALWKLPDGPMQANFVPEKLDLSDGTSFVTYSSWDDLQAHP